MVQRRRRSTATSRRTTSGWTTSGSRPRGLASWVVPIYKPEFWDKIQELDQWTNKYDPVMTCQPLGLPRHGTPRRIIQTDKDIIFFYRTNADYGGGNSGIPRHPHGWPRSGTRGRRTWPRYYGNSIGNWEGDTLVIDSINFVDTTWLGRGGLFHSGSMHIIEKLTRVGNEIRYDMTIEDPEVFVEPWVMPTRVLRLVAAAGGWRRNPGRARVLRSVRRGQRHESASTLRLTKSSQGTESSSLCPLTFCGGSPVLRRNPIRVCGRFYQGDRLGTT